MPVPPLVVLLKRWRLADRFHSAKNLSEAVAELLARVLTEIKAASAGGAAAVGQGEIPLAVEEWRSTPGSQVKQAIPTRRMYSRAGKKESATAHTCGAKSQRHPLSRITTDALSLSRNVENA